MYLVTAAGAAVSTASPELNEPLHNLLFMCACANCCCSRCQHPPPHIALIMTTRDENGSKDLTGTEKPRPEVPFNYALRFPSTRASLSLARFFASRTAETFVLPANLRPFPTPPLEHSVVGVVEFSACSSLSCTPAVPSRVTPCLLLEDHCDDDGRTAGGGSGASKPNLKKQQQQLPAGTRMAKERERGKVCCDGAQPSGQSNTKGGPAVFVAACGTFPGRV